MAITDDMAQVKHATAGLAGSADGSLRSACRRQIPIPQRIDSKVVPLTLMSRNNKSFKETTMPVYPILTNRSLRLLTKFAFSVLLVVLSAGCVSHPRYYYYDGAPRAQTEVSTVVMHGSVGVGGYLLMHRLNGTPVGALPLYSNVFDLPPGRYTLDVVYNRSYQKSQNTMVHINGKAALKLNAQPGHIYYLYPTFPSEGAWQLGVADFANIDDMSNFNLGARNDRHSGDLLKRIVGKHYKRKETHSLHVGSKYWE